VPVIATSSRMLELRGRKQPVNVRMATAGVPAAATL